MKKGILIGCGSSLLIAITIIIILIIIIGVSSTQTTTEKTTTEVVEYDEEESEEVTEEEVEDDGYYNVGDILNTGSVKITYVSCEEITQKYQSPKDGYKFISLSFDVENISNSDEFVSFLDFNCYADDYEMSAIYTETDLSTDLSIGKKGTGTVSFEVPEDAKEIIVEYTVNWWTEEKAIFIAK